MLALASFLPLLLLQVVFFLVRSVAAVVIWLFVAVGVKITSGSYPAPVGGS